MFGIQDIKKGISFFFLTNVVTGVMVWFGSIFVKKMFKPMKSSPVRIGSVVTVF